MDELKAILSLIPGATNAIDNAVASAKAKVMPYLYGAGALIVGGFVFGLAAYMRSGQPASRTLSGARRRRAR